ncbi:copper resistance CopC family protein [Parasulfitobacter algicola]|uniref:Copper resistance protein CopC n=1 Tax=Parasulfitobacter algicola TaxID=2614809 RepID=A0ABX2IKF0_9RHOB|nr:copper resistance CopC family protein [Sulfitobacter algicola]NSX53328.1 copper resistance protein CopC [Sulfitobacter algicola]
MKQILLTAMIGLWTTGAIAHSPLETTTPANEATVAEVPSEVIMDFKGNIRLTRVSMTHAETHTVDLDLDSFDGFISGYAIPLQAMGSGEYVIEWRGLGADGHALNGSFSFTVE